MACKRDTLPGPRGFVRRVQHLQHTHAVIDRVDGWYFTAYRRDEVPKGGHTGRATIARLGVALEAQYARGRGRV